jgi:hypothetical protein
LQGRRSIALDFVDTKKEIIPYSTRSYLVFTIAGASYEELKIVRMARIWPERRLNKWRICRYFRTGKTHDPLPYKTLSNAAPIYPDKPSRTNFFG